MLISWGQEGLVLKQPGQYTSQLRVEQAKDYGGTEVRRTGVTPSDKTSHLAAKPTYDPVTSCAGFSPPQALKVRSQFAWWTSMVRSVNILQYSMTGLTIVAFTSLHLAFE